MTTTTSTFKINDLLAIKLVYRKSAASRQNSKKSLLANIKDGVLPPEEISSFGGMATVDRSLLKEQDRIEKAMRTTLQKVSVYETDLGVFLTTEKVFDEIKADLADLIAQHGLWKKQFIAAYDAENEKLAAANPQFQVQIRGRKFSEDYFERQLYAGYKVIRLNNAEIGEDEEQQVSPSSVFDRLVEEVNKEANSLWSQSFKGRIEADRRILRPFSTLLKKLNALSSIDMRIQNVIDFLEHELSLMPSAGGITGEYFVMLESLVVNLSSRESFLKIIEGNFILPTNQGVKQSVMYALDEQTEAEAPQQTMPVEENSSSKQVVTTTSEEDIFAAIW